MGLYSYLVHSPVGAKYRDEANERINAIDKTPVYYSRAIERIRELAEGGDVAAMFHMGKIHAPGIATGQDLPSAVSWYEKAMKKGEPRAYANPGWFYQSGYGVRQNREKAFELLSYGADNGVVSAKAAVGMMLLNGEGCETDIEKGIAAGRLECEMALARMMQENSPGFPCSGNMTLH